MFECSDSLEIASGWTEMTKHHSASILWVTNRTDALLVHSGERSSALAPIMRQGRYRTCARGNLSLEHVSGDTTVMGSWLSI